MFGENATAQGNGATGLTIVNPQGLYDPTPNGYSMVVLAPANARLAFIAGQGGENAQGEYSTEFAVQVRQAFANLRTALDEIGARPNQVAKLTTLIVDHDMEKLGIMSGVVKEMFGSALPAQTLIPVPRLALDAMLFEVEATAFLD